MKTAALILTLSLFIISCNTRKDPVRDNPGYQIAAQVPPVGVFKQLFLNGASSLIAADYYGIAVIDLSNPEAPGVPTQLKHDLMQNINNCYYNNDTKRLWLANWGESDSTIAGMTWLAPDSFDLNDTLITGSNPLKFTAQDIYHLEADTIFTDSIHVAYISWGTHDIGVFDFIHQICHPYAPWTDRFPFSQFTWYLNPSAHVYDYAVSEDWHYAYLAVDKVGLEIIDLTSYGSASSIGSFDTEGYCRGIAVQGNYCYLADRHWGLQIIDVTDPTNPLRVSNLQFTGADDCEKIKVIGNKAAILDIYNGIYAVDISDKVNPVEIFNFDTITPTDIEVTEDYIFIIDEDAGLVIASW